MPLPFWSCHVPRSNSLKDFRDRSDRKSVEGDRLREAATLWVISPYIMLTLHKPLHHVDIARAYLLHNTCTTPRVTLQFTLLHTMSPHVISCQHHIAKHTDIARGALLHTMSPYVMLQRYVSNVYNAQIARHIATHNDIARHIATHNEPLRDTDVARARTLL